MLGNRGDGDGSITRQFATSAGDGSEPIDAIIELNADHAEGLRGAESRLRSLLQQSDLLHISKEMRIIGDFYVPCRLSLHEANRLVENDRANIDAHANGPTALSRIRAIRKIWPDEDVMALSSRFDFAHRFGAARRAYRTLVNSSHVRDDKPQEPVGNGVIWAVVDSGIDDRHPHFHRYGNLVGDVATLHRDFTVPGNNPLRDEFGHGTHVAGIIAGEFPEFQRRTAFVGERILQFEFDPDAPGMADKPPLVTRQMTPTELPSGLAPATKLVSVKVLDQVGKGKVSRVIESLEYIRTVVNRDGNSPQIHGVNLSLGYQFDPQWHGCGWTPLCQEVDRIVQSGVVVVVAAGNMGYGTHKVHEEAGFRGGMALTINDPGNTERAITVGSTDGQAPHRHGVSWFSSKGPTGDGRLKPDLVAPGERIISCASGKQIAEMEIDPDNANTVAYVEQSGTSMAAPYVSGAIAVFLSVNPGFARRPEDMKRIFLKHATSLGRDQYFQGNGLVDLKRTMGAV